MSGGAVPASPRVVALAGGVGGARLVDGLAHALPEGALTVVVNTGDDFVHWGLHIAPDLDTIMYTLAGLAHEARGWGLAEESWGAHSMMRRYGAPDWFQLGDRDLATHVFRTDRLRSGQGLSEVTRALCHRLGVDTRLLPMCEAPRPTLVDTLDQGTLSFQDWLVRERGAPRVRALRFEGPSAPTEGVIEAIALADLVVVCPSNPYVSIDPILSLDGVREAVEAARTVAVSPIVGGRAVKGPLAQMIPDLEGRPPSAAAIAAHYGTLLDAMVVETGDEEGIELPTLSTSIVMAGREDRVRLAREVLTFAREARRP